MQKLGRNDPCHCGSGKKYKRCHLDSDSTPDSTRVRISPYIHKMSGIKFDPTGNTLSLYDRNVALITGIIDIFGLDDKTNWAEIKRKISREHVKELYKLIAWLYPPDTDVAKLLPPPSDKLRSLYMGFMRPESVLNSIVRYSLYCDQILVVTPFLNPWCIAEEYNPLVHPEEYVADTIKWILFVLPLSPWILDEHVILIPDPGDFDYKLRTETWNLAKVRSKNFSTNDIANDPQMKEYSESDFKRMWLATPTYAMKEKLKEHTPSMSDKEVDDMIKYIEKQKEQDPYFPTNPNENQTFGLHTHQTGGNLEMGLFISQLTGSYMYTDFNFRWKEIESVAKDGTDQNVWGPITQAFQKLDFKFLDKVDPKFANQVRQDGRLESMRNFLRKTYQSVSEKNDVKADTLRNIKDELVEEYHKAESDWSKIDSDLAKWVTGEGGLGSVLTAGMDWKIPALGFSMAAISHLLGSRFERKRFKQNVPLSVFIDLRNKK